MWGSPDEDESVARLVRLAKNDWTHIDWLVVEVVRRVGSDASLPEFASALGELVGVLIDSDVVPGDLGEMPDLQLWSGTRQERADRVERETLGLNRRPRPGEIAWFHFVSRDGDQSAGQSA